MRELFSCGFRYPGLWNLEYSLTNPESRKRLVSGIELVPLTRNSEYSSWNPESVALYQESKTVLDYFTWGDLELFTKASTSCHVISYPDLPRPKEREISLFSVRKSEIWVRDYVLSLVLTGRRTIYMSNQIRMHGKAQLWTDFRSATDSTAVQVGSNYP